MKLRNTLTALILALTLAACSAQAGKFLGIHSADGNNPGGIYEIDAETGAAWKIYDVASALTGQQWSGNGLALDASNRRVYYTSFPGDLYVYDVDAGTNTFLGDLGHNIASGAVYQEAYYYFVQGTGELRKVTFGGSGTINEKASLGTYTDYRCDYGDIAIRSDGVLYASGSIVNGGADKFFSIDLNQSSPAITDIKSDMPSKYQLAFVDGELIGIDTGADEIFAINTGNGTLSSPSESASSVVLQNRDLIINDAAPALPVAPVALPALAVLGGVCIKRRWARA